MRRLWPLVWQGIRYRQGMSALLITAIALASLFFTLIGFVGMSAIAMQREQTRDRYGTQAIVADNTPELREALAGQSVLRDAGSVVITGEIIRKRGNLPVLAGTMDIRALSSARIRLAAGRLPEKPGEIAVEMAAISRLKMERTPAIGDRLTLEVIGADGQSAEREFTLAGLVEDYTVYWHELYDPGGDRNPGDRMPPSVFLYPGDAAAMETVREYALLDTDSMAYRDILAGLPYSLNSRVHGQLVPVYGSAVSYEELNILAVAALFAGLLAVSVICIVLNAFLLSVDKRRRQLALLRTIGATQQQARRIVVMEALVLYGIGMPAGLMAGWGLSAAAVSLFSSLTGMALLYRFHPLIPLATALITLATVLLSVIIPALRAGRSAPVAAVKSPRRRHTSRMRGSGRLSPLGLTLRSMRRGKLRTALTVFSFVLAVFLLNLGLFSANSIFYTNSGALENDYGVYRSSGVTFHSYTGIVQASPASAGTDDMAQLAEAFRERMNVRMITQHYARTINIRIPENKADDYVRVYSELNLDYGYQEPQVMKNQLRELGYAETDRIIEGSVVTADEAMLDHLQPYITEGRIDREALREGREIILCLPSYVSYRFEYENGSESGIFVADEDSMRHERDPRFKNLPIRKNTSYHAGDVLELSTIVGDVRPNPAASIAGGNTQTEPDDWDYENFGIQLENIHRRDKTVTIGAIIRRTDDRMAINRDIFSIIAGEGAPEHWALDTSVEGFYLYLNENADLDASESAFEELTAGYGDISAYSRIERAAAERQEKRMQQIIYVMIATLLGSIGLLGLFNTISSRIYARKRELAMLCAVGMTRGQVIRMLTYEGTLYGLLSAAVSTGLCLWVFTQMNIGYRPGGWVELVAWPAFIGSLTACVLIGALTVFLPARMAMKGAIIKNVRQID